MAGYMVLPANEIFSTQEGIEIEGEIEAAIVMAPPIWAMAGGAGCSHLASEPGLRGAQVDDG